MIDQLHRTEQVVSELVSIYTVQFWTKKFCSSAFILVWIDEQLKLKSPRNRHTTKWNGETINRIQYYALEVTKSTTTKQIINGHFNFPGYDLRTDPKVISHPEICSSVRRKGLSFAKLCYLPFDAFSRHCLDHRTIYIELQLFVLSLTRQLILDTIRSGNFNSFRNCLLFYIYVT